MSTELPSLCGIGLPFSTHQSSCSSRTPKTFKWIDGYGGTEPIEVWVDNAMLHSASVERARGQKRYGWICESRAIVTQLYEALENPIMLDEILDSFDAIFTCDMDLINKHDKIHFCLSGSNLPWISGNLIDKKRGEEAQRYESNENFQSGGWIDKQSICSIIGSAKKFAPGHRIRHQYHEGLISRCGITYDSSSFKDEIKSNDSNHTSQTGGVHVYGSMTGKSFGLVPECHLKGPIRREGSWHRKESALLPYYFSVVIENDKYDDYFTEKITDCFVTGTIPIYWGTKNIGKYFDTDGIIQILSDEPIKEIDSITKMLTSHMYYDRIKAVKNNLERVKTMQSADDMLFEKIKELS